MLIEITSVGGFAGIPAAGIHKRIDVDAMGATQRSRICEAFELKHLEALSKKPAHGGAADMRTYRIVITDEDDSRHVFEVPEDNIPAETLDMIDEFSNSD